MFDLGGAGFQYVQLRVIEKSQIYTNPTGPVGWVDFWDLRDPDNLVQKLNTSATVVPAVTYGTPGLEYLINASPYLTGTFMTLWTVPSPASPTSLTAVNVPVTAYQSPPNAEQLGGGTPLIDVGGRRVRNAVYKNGELVTAHSIADGSGSYARAHFLKIDVSGPTVIDDISFGATNFWYYYPAITLDPAGNSISVFNRSGYTEYAGIRYTGVLGGVVQASTQLKAGEANYIKTFGGTRNRWGDYNGIAIDPADPDQVWMFAEYAASPANTWGTWWGAVSFVPAHPPAQNLVALDGYHSSIPLYWEAPAGFSPLKTPSLLSMNKGEKKVSSPASAGLSHANPNPSSSNGMESTLLSYNIYRSTSSGGPYSLIDNVNRQYYRDFSTSNGTTYYYVVEAVYDDGVSTYSNESGATPVTDGYVIQSGFTATPPVLNGSIDAGEWASAAVTDITMPGTANPVTLYTMNDGNYLYVAVDDPNDINPNDMDQVGIYFDEDHNYEWPPSSPSGEGNFWVEYFGGVPDSTEFRSLYGWWPANLFSDGTFDALGVMEDISFSSGHIQYETRIDLTNSQLNSAPGDDIGFYIFSYDMGAGIFNGNWPYEVSPFSGGTWSGPFSYGTLVLATSGPVIDFMTNLFVEDNCANSINLVFGTAPGATDGYDPGLDQFAPPPPPSMLACAVRSMISSKTSAPPTPELPSGTCSFNPLRDVIRLPSPGTRPNCQPAAASG